MLGYLASFNGTLFTEDIMDYVTVTGPGGDGGFYKEDMDPSIFGANYLNVLLDAGNFPRSLFWFPLAFFLSIAVGFFVYKFSKSLLTQSVASLLVLSIFIGAGVVPAWCAAIFCIEALAILVANKQLGF